MLENFDLIQTLIIVAVGLGASFVQRVSGFGLGIFAMLFLPYFMPSAVSAATVSCLFSCGTSTYNAVRYRKDVPYKTGMPMLISAMVVIPIAVYFSASVPNRIFKILLGSVLVLLSCYFLFFNGKFKLKPTVTNGAIAGALGGALNGLFSTGGPPIVLYLTGATVDKKAYFAGIQFYFCITNIFATVMRAFNGLVTIELLLYSTIGMVGCMIGDFIGKIVFNKLNGNTLKNIIYLAMVISGVLMILNI